MKKKLYVKKCMKGIALVMLFILSGCVFRGEYYIDQKMPKDWKMNLDEACITVESEGFILEVYEWPKERTKRLDKLIGEWLMTTEYVGTKMLHEEYPEPPYVALHSSGKFYRILFSQKTDKTMQFGSEYRKKTTEKEKELRREIIRYVNNHQPLSDRKAKELIKWGSLGIPIDKYRGKARGETSLSNTPITKNDDKKRAKRSRDLIGDVKSVILIEGTSLDYDIDQERRRKISGDRLKQIRKLLLKGKVSDVITSDFEREDGQMIIILGPKSLFDDEGRRILIPERKKGAVWVRLDEEDEKKFFEVIGEKEYYEYYLSDKVYDHSGSTTYDKKRRK